jgi:hypothetical protein
MHNYASVHGSRKRIEDWWRILEIDLLCHPSLSVPSATLSFSSSFSTSTLTKKTEEEKRKPREA